MAADPPAADFADPEVLLRQIREAELDLAHALDPSGLRLDTGFATLDLEHGVLIPVRGAGRTVEMVFVGRGRAQLEAVDQVEAGQLELFTGSPQLAEVFTEAVFVVALDAAAEALLRRPAAEGADPEILRRAGARYAVWRDSPERRTLGVETGILLDALGDPLYEEYFAGWFLGERLGPFLLQLDPAAEEQISLGQFVRFEATPERKRSLSRFLHRQQQRGRLIGLEVDTLGRWDSWLQAPLATAGGEPRPGSPGFEPRHYVIDVAVDPRTGNLASQSRVELEAVSGGRRVVRLELHADLEITRLAESGGGELFYLREGNQVLVLLPHLPEAGENVALDVACEGTFLERGGDAAAGRRDASWALRNALGWYPRTSTNERATYDVTLRWPRRYDLVASGQRVGGGETGGLRWQRRHMEVPTLGFSFEIGRFEVESIHVGDVRLTVALDPGTRAAAADGAIGELLFTVADALRFYQKIFGPYPLGQLTVVTVPRQYSQAMLGFVTLSSRTMADWGNFGPLLRVQDKGSVVAHEVAHQWWGHLVGWRSYRDQWISEAMANYAAVLWARHRGLQPAVGPVTGWQQELTATVADGRPIESLGPLVLGERLFSSRSQEAYQAIVYRKGALVLEMLARRFGEADFLRALEALIRAAAGNVISTGDFLSLLEQITATDLSGFARQFIYGTGLPEIDYDYAFEPIESGWRVRIDARQELPARTRYAVVRLAGGRLDVARGRVEQDQGVESSELVVPLQIQLAGGSAGQQGAARDGRKRNGAQDGRKRNGAQDGRKRNLAQDGRKRNVARDGRKRSMLVGRMVISGRHTEVEIELEDRPVKLWLDRDSQIFGRFLDRRQHPKRMLLQEAAKQAAEGELEAAEDTLHRALAAHSPLASTDHLLDAHLHLQLAGVRLDADRDADAVASLARAREAFEQGRSELPHSETLRFRRAFEVAEARIEIRRGDYDAAFERLTDGVLDRDDATSTEGYLLLAIAAQVTGHDAELAAALDVARRRGADVAELEPPAGGVNKTEVTPPRPPPPAPGPTG